MDKSSAHEFESLSSALRLIDDQRSQYASEIEDEYGRDREKLAKRDERVHEQEVRVHQQNQLTELLLELRRCWRKFIKAGAGRVGETQVTSANSFATRLSTGWAELDVDDETPAQARLVLVTSGKDRTLEVSVQLRSGEQALLWDSSEADLSGANWPRVVDGAITGWGKRLVEGDVPELEF